MSARTGVLCALRGPAETAVVRALADTPDLVVVRRCADLTELLAAGEAGYGGVAVLQPDLAGMDRRAVRHLQACGVAVVVLADAEPDLGEDVRVSDAADVVDAVRAALRGRGGSDADVGAGHDGGARTHVPPRTTAPGEDPHRVVAVWGPTGAPGRTTVAVGLATALAAGAAGARLPTLLVDADTYGGTVAPALGLLDEAPGLVAAARTALGGRLDATTLASLSPVTGTGLRVLTGPARADRWTELPVAGLEPVWDVCREIAAVTVVDCGFCVEEDEVLSYDTRAPRRNGATLSALTAADVVVVVGGADPIGLQRLVRGLDDLASAGVTAGRRVVVANRVRASAAGPRPEGTVRQALRRYAGVEDVVCLPDDPATCDAALLHGRSVVEHAPGSRLARALGRLVEQVVVADAPLAAH